VTTSDWAITVAGFVAGFITGTVLSALSILTMSRSDDPYN
jgi:hypothetical protein